ncbi:MAG TPA: hypothetical protein VN605_04410 [Thermoanaerobaculia bacterium]|nr:hypothetical protein [Thermoanaerobaculia bacterium]
MDLLTVKSVEGQHWSVQENSAVQAAEEPASPAAALLGVMPSGEGVALRAMANGMYLSARGHDRSLWAMAPEAGAEETFRVERGNDGSSALRASDGSYVVLGEGGVVRMGTAGEGSRFVLENQKELMEALLSQKDCCGHGDDHASASGEMPAAKEKGGFAANAAGKTPGRSNITVEWNDPQHQRVLIYATELLRAFQSDPKLGQSITHFLNWWRSDIFRREVQRGLKEADEKSEFTGNLTFAGIQIYYMHFYDPDKDDNFMNWKAKYPENALTEFRRRFEQSISASRSWSDGNRMVASAYMFGVALHYLSDITQPMHAANFPNIWPKTIPDPTDWRHSSFENVSDNIDVPLSLEPREQSAADIDPARFASIGDLFLATARHSKGVWNNSVRALTDARYDGFFNPWKPFQQNEITDSVRATLRPAYRNMAAAMISWMQKCDAM